MALYSQRMGVSQADTYIQGLGQVIQNLTQSPMIGVSIEHIYPECRLFHYQNHIIIYMHTNATLIIQRVLHKRMDITRHTVQ